MTTKIPRKSYNQEFKEAALELAKSKGAPTAAKELGVASSQLYGWRSAAAKKTSTSDREAELMTEVAKLKRELADQKEIVSILKKAVTYFATDAK